MRILNVTAQKPNSTGSGIFLSELMKEFANKGHTQALVAGVYPEEETPVPDRVTFYPVYFEQGKLNFPIVGMSDEMPYPSTRYRDMTPKMEAAFKESFLKQLDEAVRDLNPDLILCHHLYLLTAIVREHFPDRKVFGFCHNTDLRQMQKTDLEREYITGQIRRLDRIFALHAEQKRTIQDIYDVPKEKIQVIGMGYNSHIFKNESLRVNDGVTRIAFAGKISEIKGVESLIRSLDYLEYVSLDELLATSNLISLHCPLTEETKHIINEKTIAKMKDGVVLVNTSRGGLIKTEDLISGIRDHKFSAVGLDVYEEETDFVFEDMSERILQSSITQRLLSFPNVVMTSHQGFFTKEALTNIAETTMENAKAFMNGDELKNEVLS